MLYEKLTNKDIECLYDYVSLFAGFDDCRPIVSMGPVENVLRQWAINKQHFYQMFGENFILEKEIEFIQPKRDIERLLDEELSDEDTPIGVFKRKVFSWADSVFNPFDEARHFITGLFCSDNLIDNVVKWLPHNEKVYTLNILNKEIKISQGMKVIKVLSKIAKALDLTKEFEAFRISHSMVLNTKRLKGTLCLSIHPLDYLTMSDNANCWSSCMSWCECGDYRSGTVEMMNSSSVIVAYLKSNDKTLNFGPHEWNSKMWRTLIVMTPEVGISVKGYPYQHAELTELSMEWLRDLAAKNLDWHFGPYQELDVEGSSFVYDNRCVRIDMETNNMYNDFSTVSHYGYLSNEVSFIDHNYSGELTCIYCGETFDPCDHNFVCCDNCAVNDTEMVYCEECGERYHQDDIYWVEDSTLCPDCFYDLAVEDEIWGDYIFKTNAIKIYLLDHASEIDSLDENDYFIYASMAALRTQNYENRFSTISRYAINPPHEIPNEPNSYYWISDELTKDGLRYLFGIR